METYPNGIQANMHEQRIAPLMFLFSQMLKFLFLSIWAKNI